MERRTVRRGIQMVKEIKHWYTPIQKVIKKLILPAVVVLLFIIIAEFFYKDAIEPYILYFEIADGIIVGIFVLDLIFEYLRIRKFWPFVKRSWLDIIAIFPFFLLFRALERMYIIVRFGEQVSEAQSLLHTGVAVTKESSAIAKEAELARGAARVFEGEGKFMRFIKPALRSLRLIKGVKEHKRIKKDIKNIHKTTKKTLKKLK